MRNTTDTIADYTADNNFVFYGSFYESIRILPPDVQLEIYNALCGYGCCGEIPEGMSVVARAMFMALQPQIDASQSRYARAVSGGAPKGVCNNPNGRRGKRPKPSADNTNPETNEQTQPIEKQTSEQTETNSETNPEQKNKLNIELKEEIKLEDNCSRNYARAREVFVEDFFTDTRMPAITRQAEALGVTVAEFRNLVGQVLDDWELNGPIPEPDNDVRRHMLNTVRRKHEAQVQQSLRRRSVSPSVIPVSPAPATAHDSAYYERIEASSKRREEMAHASFLSGEALRAKLAAFDLDNPAA
ncbi:MAG: hypothetical protein K2N28_05230 [Muribaculaceae bacterium]|nr:hypothetical protein [Muribaculaceae bacterium]